MFDWAMNQDIQIRRFIEFNREGEPKYSTIETIKGRLEYKRNLVRDRNGEQVVSETLLFTKDMLDLNDCIVIDDVQWFIINLAPKYSVYGVISHYEVRF